MASVLSFCSFENTQFSEQADCHWSREQDRHDLFEAHYLLGYIKSHIALAKQNLDYWDAATHAKSVFWHQAQRQGFAGTYEHLQKRHVISRRQEMVSI
jgi:hypothetical protein